jgi:hypothetical protein
VVVIAEKDLVGKKRIELDASVHGLLQGNLEAAGDGGGVRQATQCC